MDILLTAINAALFVGCLLSLTQCKRDAKHVERRRKAFDDGMARLHAVRVELASIAAAHDATVHQLSKLRGKFYSTLQKAPSRPATLEEQFEDGELPPQRELAELDPEIAAHIALQTAAPKAPGAP